MSENNDCKTGIALIEYAIQIFQGAGNKARQGFALPELQYIRRIEGDNETALVMVEKALELFRSCGDQHGIARSLFWMGTSFLEKEKYGDARIIFEEALEEFEIFGNKFYIAVTKESLGEINRGLYEYEKAEACYRECLALRQEIGEAPINFSLEYMNLGYTALYRGDDKLAVSFFREALRLNREWGERKGALITCLEGFAAVAVVRDKAEEAALIYGVAQSLRNMSLADLSQRDISLSSVDRRELEHYKALCRAKLGDELFEVTLERGRTMTLDEAISLAVEQCQPD